MVRCPECSSPQTFSASWARRKRSFVCEDCRNPRSRERLRKRHMRFWLKRYSDDEIARMATEVHDVPLRPDLVAAHRAALLP